MPDFAGGHWVSMLVGGRKKHFVYGGNICHQTPPRPAIGQATILLCQHWVTMAGQDLKTCLANLTIHNMCPGAGDLTSFITCARKPCSLPHHCSALVLRAWPSSHTPMRNDLIAVITCARTLLPSTSLLCSCSLRVAIISLPTGLRKGASCPGDHVMSWQGADT
eukprot:scaffold157284_cov19-Tisochrysis_lutea.AAC.3